MKAQADVELEDARAVVDQADADISRAEAQFAAGKVPEQELDVRASIVRSAACVLLTRRATGHPQEALNAKDAAQEALQEAEEKYDAACVALKATLSEEAERQDSRKCVSASDAAASHAR